MTVVLAAENYPARPRTGDVITGADDGALEGETLVLHAGTDQRADKALVSAGGRVLNVVGVGADLAQARERAYARLAGIKLTGSHFRTDIGATEVVVPERNSVAG